MCSRSSWARSRPHRHLSTLVALAVADRDHALGQTDILYPELHQFGGTGAGLQQGLQHQAGPPTLVVGLIEEAQFLLDGQPVDAAAPFGRSVQGGALPGGFEHFLALGVINPLADEDGGDGSHGTRDGDHIQFALAYSGCKPEAAGTSYRPVDGGLGCRTGL
jgi:hypothetical protein